MTDLDRVKQMQELNWKPAQTYWKERHDKVLALYQAEQDVRIKLEFLVEKAEELRNVLEDFSDRDTYLSRRASRALQDLNRAWTEVFDD